MLFRQFQRCTVVLTALLLTGASAVADTPGVVGAQQQMLGAIPGERQSAPANFRITWHLPALDQYAPAKVRGGGPVAYYLHGTTIRLQGEQLPVLHGRLPISKEMPNPPVLTVTGVPRSLAHVQWGVGRDITCSGLGVVVEVRDPDSGDVLATVRQDNIALTSGTITVADKPVVGAVEIAKMQVRLVGTFPMPATGLKAVDAVLAGQPILMQVTVAAQPLE